MKSTTHLQSSAQLGRIGIYMLLLFMALLVIQLSGRTLSAETFLPLLAVCFAGFLFQMTHLIFDETKNQQIISFLIDAILIQIYVHYSFQLSALIILFHLVNIFLAAVNMGSLTALITALFSAVVFGVSQILFRDGSSSNLLMSYCLNLFAFVVVGGIAGYLSELLRQTQGELFDVKEIQRRVYDISPVGILVSKWSAVGGLDVLDFNSSVPRIFHSGSDQKELFQHPFFQQLAELREKSFFSKDVEVHHETKHLLIQQSPLELSENLKLLVTTISDQTELKKLEWDLKQKEKLAAIGGLAAGIAHEIRNPLASISGSVELLSQNTQSEEDQKLMKIILKEISRLNILISEFLDYAKPERPPQGVIDLQNVIREGIGAIKLSKDLLSILPSELIVAEELQSAYIHGDMLKLKQVFLNFFINSVQAMKDASQPRLRVSLMKSAEHDFAVVEIMDSGVGMSEDTQKKIFEPFFTTKPKGTGLGLAMTHKILVAHQASVEVESKLGQGTLFRLKFPLVNPK